MSVSAIPPGPARHGIRWAVRRLPWPQAWLARRHWPAGGPGQRPFLADAPDRFCRTDISEYSTSDGNAYLCAVDVFPAASCARSPTTSTAASSCTPCSRRPCMDTFYWGPSCSPTAHGSGLRGSLAIGTRSRLTAVDGEGRLLGRQHDDQFVLVDPAARTARHPHLGTLEPLASATSKRIGA